jgi:hypothetical protein
VVLATKYRYERSSRRVLGVAIFYTDAFFNREQLMLAGQ